MKITEEMKWDAIDNLTSFLGNYGNHKNQNGACKEPKIKEAMDELINNLQIFVETGSRYEVSNFINGLSFLMKHSEYDKIQDEEKIGKQDDGFVYMIDYALTDGNTTANRHPGLCINTYGEKCFVIPMMSGFDQYGNEKEKFTKAYHPTDNLKGTMKYRRGLIKEGFKKDCILIINDAQFVSVDRIGDTICSIDRDVFYSIESHLLKVSMPWKWLQLRMYSNRCKDLEPLSQNQKRKIDTLEKEIEELKGLLETKKS